MSCFCPFKITQSYLRLRGGYAQAQEQFFIFRDKAPVQPVHLRKILKMSIANIGLDESFYDIHSLRIGHCMDMIRFGYTIDQIKRAGRLRPNTVYKYIKD